MGELEENARQFLRDRRETLLRAQRAREPTVEEAREFWELDAALLRLQDGSYGLCQRCGGAVGRQRLRALPAVRMCLGCSSAG